MTSLPRSRRAATPGRVGSAVALLVLVLVVLALLARLLHDSPAGQAFLTAYPGYAPQPATAPVGFPGWVAVQHGLNALFMLFVLWSGWQVHRTRRPTAFWIRNARRPSRNPPVRIALHTWLHLTVDTLWVLNGVVFVVLLFASGQWLRVVPTNWAVLPNAVSATLQYASLDWPTETGWTDYNALQQLSYFGVTFLLAPIAVLTGLRVSPGFAARLRPLDRAFPLAVARRVHWWTSVLFAVFIAVHVVLVLATGALRNLNHMYGLRNDDSWLGFWVFIGTVLVMAAAVLAARPVVLRGVASTMGTITRR